MLQKYKNRDSNMELLRIVAMLGVLIVHADFYSLEAPTKEECLTAPYVTTIRILIESATIISVNLFVLLSGWYGIRVKKNRLFEFLFQTLFFNLLFFTIFSFFIPNKTFSKDGIESVFVLDKSLWFVKAYLLLYLLSPILNAFSEKATQKQYKFILIGFFVFQTVFGWLFHSVVWFKGGYSTISFIGLYLLSGFYHKYGNRNPRKRTLLLIFILFILTNSILLYSSIYKFNGAYNNFFVDYNSPMVIIASLSIFLFFTKLHIKKNKIINYIAASCFAAYLFQMNHFFAHEIFITSIKRGFINNNFFIFIIETALFLITIFIASIILDKIRLWIWEWIIPKTTRTNRL